MSGGRNCYPYPGTPHKTSQRLHYVHTRVSRYPGKSGVKKIHHATSTKCESVSRASILLGANQPSAEALCISFQRMTHNRNDSLHGVLLESGGLGQRIRPYEDIGGDNS
eukprot:3323907-Rhodomonas_salina.1